MNTRLVSLGRRNSLSRKCPRVINLIRRHCTTSNGSMKKYFSLVDEHWIEVLVDTLRVRTQFNLLGRKIFIVNPGSAPLCAALLAAGCEDLMVWDDQALHTSPWQLLQQQHPDKLQLNSKNFFRTECFKDHKKLTSSWEKENDHLCVVGFYPRVILHPYIWHLTEKLAYRMSLHELGRVPQFVFLSGMDHRLLFDSVCMSKQQVVYSILLKVFYDMETVLKVPTSAFQNLPKLKDAWKDKEYDKDHLFLVKFVPKSTSVFEREDMVSYMHMLKFLKNRGHHRLVPTLEEICPNSGIDVIEMGYTMFDIVRDVPLDSWPSLYQIVSSMSEFKQTSLYKSIHEQC